MTVNAKAAQNVGVGPLRETQGARGSVGKVDLSPVQSAFAHAAKSESGKRSRMKVLSGFLFVGILQRYGFTVPDQK